MKCLVLLSCVVATGAATAQEYPRGLPPIVQRFIERKIDCDHWMGEQAYDAERRAEIKRALAQLRCPNLSSDKTTLEHRYRYDPSTLKQLQEWAGDTPSD